MTSDRKPIILIVLINFILSLIGVFLSPRLDILTFLIFMGVNALLFFLFSLYEGRKRRMIKEEIDDIFSLLHRLDTDALNLEVKDDEFGRLRDELIKVISENKTLAQKSEERGEILRVYTEDIAHQLKTPLTGVLLLLDLMEEDGEGRGAYLERLRAEIERLYELADLLLELASLDAELTKMKRDEVPASSLVEGVISNLDIIFKDLGEKVVLRGEDFILSCDRRWTYEALFNIVKNGLEASRDRGIVVELRESNLYYSILIEDFSPGLDAESLKKVFRRFCKMNQASKGYGLGLPLAKSVMEKQGGDLLYVRGRSSNTFELRFYK